LTGCLGDLPAQIDEAAVAVQKNAFAAHKKLL
jgi:hypothetical protein